MAAEEIESSYGQNEVNNLASEAAIPLTDILKSYGIEVEDSKTSVQMTEQRKSDHAALNECDKSHFHSHALPKEDPEIENKNGKNLAKHIDNPMFDPGGSWGEVSKDDYLEDSQHKSPSASSPDVIDDSDEDFSTGAVNAEEDMVSPLYHETHSC